MTATFLEWHKRLYKKLKSLLKLIPSGIRFQLLPAQTFAAGEKCQYYLTWSLDQMK